MRGLPHIALILALASAVAGCETIRAVDPAPTATPTPDAGPCGDGRVLRPGEQCP